MPVITLSLTNLKNHAQNKMSQTEILDNLPYLGLDIEGVRGDSVSIEYSPNRPDFSSEAGIARSLVGLLGIEVGLPRYDFGKSQFEIVVNRDKVHEVRPHIFGIYSELAVTEEIIKQLITMQEDLHNGIGRRRSLVAIGIHNAEVISKKIRYYLATDKSYSFIPLGFSRPKSIEQILTQTEQGIKYGNLVKEGFPLLEDEQGHVLSMPPIINGELTRLREGVKRLFIDVTATDYRAGETTAAIIASMLSDTDATVKTVEVKSGSEVKITPDMNATEVPFDLQLANRIIGFSLDERQAEIFLGRSRIELASKTTARIPRYRADIIHPVDLAEEIALGYGISKIEPSELASSLSGSFNGSQKKLDSIVDILVGLGLCEIWNLSLVSRKEASGCIDSGRSLKVDEPKSNNFEYLRCDLTASLLSLLGSSSDQEYPQRIFEISPVFQASKEKNHTGLKEEVHVAVLLAGAESNYTVARSILDSFLRLAPILDDDSVVIEQPVDMTEENYYLSGRSASVLIQDKDGRKALIGTVGEISPSSLSKFGVLVPVSGFELDLESMLKS